MKLIESKILNMFNNETQKLILKQKDTSDFIDFIYRFIQQQYNKNTWDFGDTYFKILTVDIGFDHLNKDCKYLFIQVDFWDKSKYGSVVATSLAFKFLDNWILNYKNKNKDEFRNSSCV